MYDGRHLERYSTCVNLLDDILVTGNSPEEHLSNLEAVLTRLKDVGLCLKKKKCAFMLEVIEYLSHKSRQT